MSLLSMFQKIDINEGINRYQNTNNAFLVDVRTKEEYKSGHIKGSLNIPLQNIERITQYIKDLNTPIFIYCLSGSRSRQAQTILKKMGYTNITNIGGINRYHGQIER